jgi:hypothetical protein
MPVNMVGNCRRRGKRFRFSTVLATEAEKGGMAEGIIDFLEFAAAVVLAAPVGLLGVILLSNGDAVGGVAFLAIAVGMVALDRYVVAPRDLVTGVLSRLVGRAAKTDDE